MQMGLLNATISEKQGHFVVRHGHRPVTYSTVWGTFYSFPLTPDGNVKLIEPLDWQSPTEFKIALYEGPVKWTQYKPKYFKQEGGYTFTCPGDRAGEDFLLFVDTDCGVIGIETAIDDPTPIPVAGPK